MREGNESKDRIIGKFEWSKIFHESTNKEKNKNKIVEFIIIASEDDTEELNPFSWWIGTGSCYYIDRDGWSVLMQAVPRNRNEKDDALVVTIFSRLVSRDIGSENDNNYSRAVCHERSITRRQLTLKNRLESRTIRFPKDHPLPLPLPLPLPTSFSPLNPPRDIRFPRTKTIGAPPALRVVRWKMEGLLIFIRSPWRRVYTFADRTDDSLWVDEFHRTGIFGSDEMLGAFMDNN